MEDGTGPLDGGVTVDFEIPGVILGNSGTTSLEMSTPEGFWPDLMLEISSLIVLIDDLYSWKDGPSG